MKTKNITETRKYKYNPPKEINKISNLTQMPAKYYKSIIYGLNTPIEECEEFEISSLLEDDKIN
jgi:hypothetical protein